MQAAGVGTHRRRRRDRAPWVTHPGFCLDHRTDSAGAPGQDAGEEALLLVQED